MAQEAPPSTELVTLTSCALSHISSERKAQQLTRPDVWRRQTLSQQAKLGPQASGDLTILLTAIQTTCKFLSHNVRRARLINMCVGPRDR